MSRTLKRPMFRMGGSTSTGITSGLDQPRKQYNQGSNPYAMGNFAPGTGPGFLTSFGLDLMSRPPQGNIFQTAATSAKEPFERFQAAQLRSGEMRGERDFLQSERKAGEEFKAGENELTRANQLEIAGMKSNKSDALYNNVLGKYLEADLPSQVAVRAATFETELADTLRGAVGGEKYGGILTFDTQNQEQVKGGLRELLKLNNKVVYDPFEDNYKYVLIRDGQPYFTSYKTIPEIKFPDISASQPEQSDNYVPDFGMSMDDPSP